MSDIICVPLTVSRTDRREKKRWREDGSGKREREEKQKEERSRGTNDREANEVKEDDRSEA